MIEVNLSKQEMELIWLIRETDSGQIVISVEGSEPIKVQNTKERHFSDEVS